LKSKIPAEFLNNIGSSAPTGQIAYAIVPLIPGLNPPIKEQVQDAFVESFKRVWIAFTVCSAVGMLSFFIMKNYPLKKTVDGKWGIDKERKEIKEKTGEVSSGKV